ncbi:hypothetical protein SDC9_46401 [bioreactor metagenome]|uniref:Uncharacterized protein n=1 Tax=bioreactor metagenome TaxID=1076179 RepID=A0A644W9I6_9ZZZZ
MGVDHPRVRDAEALGAQRLETKVIDPGGDSALDPLVEQVLEGREEHGLHVDRQRQQAIEEGRDRRQVIFKPVVIGQAQTGRILKGPERTARDIAAIEAAVELAQGVAGIGALEVVLGAKQPLPAGLALAARDGSQRVEAAGDGGEEPLLCLHIRRHRPKKRRLRLIGAVGTAEALDGSIGLPAGFQEVVDPQALVFRA